MDGCLIYSHPLRNDNLGLSPASLAGNVPRT
jgi:hypothetical protein